MRKFYRNAALVTESGVIKYTNILTDNGKIAYIGKDNHMTAADITVEVDGNYLSAGFIDIHVHGGNGYEFMDGTKESFGKIAEYHASHGITSMLATTLAGDMSETLAFLDAYNEYAPEVSALNYLGVHLEGPFFNPKQAGAQDPKYLVPPTKENYAPYLKYGCVKRVSLAPELDGASEFTRELLAMGAVVSAGHTDASFAEMEEAHINGFSLMTHLYSAMSGVHRRGVWRTGGAIEAGLLIDTLYAEIIADGLHLPECLLKLIVKCKGREKIILVSDASRGAGLAEGTIFKLGSLEKGQDVKVKDDIAMLMDETAFAGSVASGDRLVRTMVKTAGLPIHDAVYMITATPAKLLGIDSRKGSIEVGKDADIVVFDENINIIHNSCYC